MSGYTWPPAPPPDAGAPGPATPIGMVVGGSLSGGLTVRLHPHASVEDIKVGTFVTVQGQKHRFFAIVSDMGLEVADPRLRTTPPDLSTPVLAEALSGTAAYTTLTVTPQLVLPPVLGEGSSPAPAKTVPSHFSPAYIATERDVALVFGTEDRSHFWIGNPLDMETKVCLDMDRFVQRSAGVFGKSGTGKSFLTRLLLIGILQSDLASCLVFDMHSEYGWRGRDPERNREVKGLKQLFPQKVAVFSLDRESALRRGLRPDHLVRIGYDDITPEDVELLREALGLSEVATQAAYALERHFGREGWLQDFLALEGRDRVYELARELNINERALAALHNRLSRLTRFAFLTPQGEGDSVGTILHYLDRGMSVVLEFGRYGSDITAYILVANLLSRRIHRKYVERVEEAMGDRARYPRPLVMVIEEAHKFLGPEVARQTPFGTIAREMRKYNVSLLVIDQRPSGLDPEVMSQVGTKITCFLDNERDVEAVLSGAPGSRELRSVLARLDTRQQALLFGDAVPMPVVVQVREYGSEASYASLTRYASVPPPPEDEEDPFR